MLSGSYYHGGDRRKDGEGKERGVKRDNRLNARMTEAKEKRKKKPQAHSAKKQNAG